MNHYLPIRHELAMIHGNAMEGKRIIIPLLLQKQILNSCPATIYASEKTILDRKLKYSVDMLGISADTTTREDISI